MTSNALRLVLVSPGLSFSRVGSTAGASLKAPKAVVKSSQVKKSPKSCRCVLKGLCWLSRCLPS